MRERAHDARERRTHQALTGLWASVAHLRCHAERFPALGMGGWRARVVSRRCGRTSGSADAELLFARLRELMGRAAAR